VLFVSNPELLSKRAKRPLNTSMEEKGIIISSVSTWEVALLVAKKRLQLTLSVTDWIVKSEALPFIRLRQNTL